MARAVWYAKVDERAAERNSQRNIIHVTGVSRMAIADRLKKLLPLCRFCRACGPSRTSTSGGRRLNSMRYGPLRVVKSAQSGSGWPSSGPADVSWLG